MPCILASLREGGWVLAEVAPCTKQEYAYYSTTPPILHIVAQLDLVYEVLNSSEYETLELKTSKFGHRFSNHDVSVIFYNAFDVFVICCYVKLMMSNNFLVRMHPQRDSGAQKTKGTNFSPSHQHHFHDTSRRSRI